MATDTKDFVTDMFKQASESFTRTMSTGVEFQQQAGKFWGDFFGKGFDQFHTQMDKASNGFAPDAKKNLEQFHKMFDEQSHKSMDMLRKTFESGECCNAKDMFDETMKMWQTSFETMRTQVDTMAKTNVEMAERFCDMANQATATNGHKATSKPATK